MWEEGVDFLVHLLCLFQALYMEGTEIPSSNYYLTITIHGFLKNVFRYPHQVMRVPLN